MLVDRGHHRHPVILTSFLCLMWHASYHLFWLIYMDINIHVPKSLKWWILNAACLSLAMINVSELLHCSMIWIDLTNDKYVWYWRRIVFLYVQQKKLLKFKRDRGALSVWNIPRAHWRMCWRWWAGPCCRHTPLPRRSGSGTALRSWAAQSPLCTV